MAKKTKKLGSRTAILILLLVVVAAIFIFSRLTVSVRPVASEQSSTSTNSTPTPKATASAVPTSSPNVRTSSNTESSPAAGIPNKAGTPTPAPNLAPKPFYVGVDIKDSTVNIDYQLPVIADGTCTARFTKPGFTAVTGSSPTARVTNYSACKTIVIQKSAFSQMGDWTLVVTFTGSNGTASSDSRIITVY